MQTFEIVLILANLVTLFLHFRQQSRSIWLWSTGINLAVLIIHGIFEGLRYQMAFSYIFVIVLVVFTAIKRNGKSERKSPRVLKSITIGLSFLLLAFTAFIAYALPVFRLPKPTGNYAVGIQYLHLIDENRTDPFIDGTTQKRELMVKIYYPATDDRSKPFAPYFHSPELVRLFTTFHGMPEFMFSQLNLAKTNSKEGLQLSDKEQSYPVILFSHGAGTTMETQTSQGEDLASHGYIVAAIDHTYMSSASIFPNRIVSSKEATTDFGIDPTEILTQIMADNSSFVIDQLAEMNEGKVNSIFKGKLNLDEIGAMGHSVGGAVAYNLAINDTRVKAAIDIDGVVYVTPKGDPSEIAPFLMLANDKYHIQAIENREPLLKRFEDMDEIDQKITVDIYGSEQAYQDAYDKAQQNVVGLTEVLKADDSLYTIEGSDHMKFTDIGLFIAVPQLREMIGIGGKTDPARVSGNHESTDFGIF
ncbi:MAG: hypothetical protein QM730_15195 [Anaerolineales bacterium]